jgi:hypothetical protein
MHFIAVTVAAFVASGPAAAQTWTEYSYPEDSFAVSFPAPPRVETTTQEGPDGRSAIARIYSVVQDHASFTVAIVDLSDPPVDENVALDYAIKALSQGAKSSSTFPARVTRVFGRELSIFGTDGSHSSAAVFYLDGRLYVIQAKVLPPESDALAIRFQQSLAFMRGVSNRPADRNSRRGCRGYDRGNDDVSLLPENCRRGGQRRPRLLN